MRKFFTNLGEFANREFFVLFICENLIEESDTSISKIGKHGNPA